MAVTPGKTITLEITSVPRSRASQKTLVRLCRMDPSVARHHRMQSAKRPSQEFWRRGNKQWHHQMKSMTIVKLVPGAKYTLRASVDVLRDLASIGDCVKVASK